MDDYRDVYLGPKTNAEAMRARLDAAANDLSEKQRQDELQNQFAVNAERSRAIPDSCPHCLRPNELESEEKTIRGEFLDEAKRLTEGDRNVAYGDPVKNLTVFSNLCETFIRNQHPDTPPAVTGAVINCMSKISRIAANPWHRDNYVDLTAYAAIAGEAMIRMALDNGI